MKDLIELIEYRLNIKLWQGVNDLRNNVMHSHELVNRLDVTREDYIYDFKTFEDFFKKVEALLQDRKRVNNKIAFIHLMEA